jgi:hypothetical protein
VKALSCYILLLAIIIFSPHVASCQTDINAINTTDQDSLRPDLKRIIAPVKPVPLKDLADVVSSLFKKNKGVSPATETAAGKSVFSGVAAIGYTLQTKIAGTVAGNIAFRPDTNARFSTITSNITYTQNKQFFWPIQSSIWTKNKNYVFVGDFRYYKYPQSTFGLGTNSIVESEDPMSYQFFRFYEIVLKKITGDFYGGIGYILDYRWRISHTGTFNRTESDFEKYGPAGKTISSGITINGLYDTRDNPINAQQGFYTSLQLRNNIEALGSNNNWRSLIVDMRKYFRLPASSNNVLAFWSYNWLVLSGKPPYLDLPSNGWDSYNSTGRGYIQGRFRGAQMVYLESEYRFNLSANGLFGAAFFGNAQTFSGAPGTGLQQVRPGFGTGLRIKIKKTSRTNLAIDYGFGTEGSKGLFISVGEYF